MKEVIVCDKCGHEGCTVSEKEDTRKISMKEYASKCKTPYGSDIYRSATQMQHSTWIITCPKCDHEVVYSTHPAMPMPMYGEHKAV